MHRRNFLQQTASLATAQAIASAFFPLSTTAHAASSSTSDHPIAIFAKVFQKHSFSQLADVVEKTNADGVEATIRSGGHIDPTASDYASQVGKMVSELAARDKRLLIAATDINSVSKENRQLLTVLKDNGVTYYRLGYYNYKPHVSPVDQVKQFADQAKALADLNGQLGIVGLYQNHAGKANVGNLIWDLAILLDGIPVSQLGVALDLRHLRAEIGGSYETAVDAIRSHIASVYLKDTKRTGSDGQSLQEVALGHGMVSKALFRDAIKSVAPAPLSVHVEYLGQKPHPPGDDAMVTQAYRDDVATLRSWMS